MKKTILLFILSTVLFSCNTHKNLTNEPQTTNDTLSTETTSIPEKTIVEEKIASPTYLKVTNEHYNLKNTFNTLQINADISFKNNRLKENVTADIRIEKDKNILISLKKFGITGAKIFITPTRVSYYEIVNGSHYDGDFDFISRFLGTDLDFNQIQNLLLGTAVYDLAEEPLTTKVEDGVYKLYKETNNLNIVFILDGLARMKQEVINQKGSQDKLIIDYLAYQTKDDVLLPNNLLIRAIQNGETNINVNYKKVEINPEISFPYKIPNGSKAINF